MNQTDSHPTAAAPDGHEDHKSHTGIFVVVFLMLMGLTGLSFWIANSHLMENRTIGWTAMMAVSVAKAMLVITFFMHLWWEKKWKYILTFPALVMGALLVMLLVPDVGARQDTYSKTRQKAAAEVNTNLGGHSHAGPSDQTSHSNDSANHE